MTQEARAARRSTGSIGGVLWAMTRWAVVTAVRGWSDARQPAQRPLPAISLGLDRASGGYLLRVRARTVVRIGEALRLAVVPLMAVFFLWWYGRVLITLPLFGDAANHARLARAMLRDGFWNTASPYPPLYHVVAGVALWAGGEQGFIWITIIGVVAVGVAVYAFAREVSGSEWVAIVSALIAFVTPKMPFYAGRLYMEIPLTAAVVISLTFFHRYLRLRQRRDLILAAVCIGVTTLIKQQGLFVMIPAVAFLAAEAGCRIVLRRGSVRALLSPVVLFWAICVVIVLPAGVVMLRTTGRVVPDTEFTMQANRVGARLAGYHQPQPPAVEANWNLFLDNWYQERGYLTRGSQKAEQRHVWPQDMITANGFFSINSPYWRDVALVGARLPWKPTIALNVFFIAGLVFWFVSPRSRAFTAFFALFLAMNYLSFIRGNDQWRYYLYLPFLMAFAIPLSVDRVCGRLGSKIRIVGALALAAFVAGYAATYLPERTDAAHDYESRQAYAPSKGGMASVQDASRFLKSNLGKDQTFYAVPQTEFQYYADRAGIFDWRIYFLDVPTLARYFDEHAITYVVVSDSTVRPDPAWRHVVTVPRSFRTKIDAMYPLAYRTRAGDIAIYRVLPASAVPPLTDLDFLDPTARIEAPEEGAAVSGPVTVQGVASDNRSMQQMLFYIDGEFKYGQRGSAGTYTWTWDSSTVENGRHTIWIKAVDTAGNWVTQYITVTVDN